LDDGEFVLYYWVPKSIWPVEYLKLTRIFPAIDYIPSRYNAITMNIAHYHKVVVCYFLRSPHAFKKYSSVGIATGYRLEAGIRFQTGVRILLFFTASTSTAESTQLPTQWLPRDFSLG
jgi:hypothetical protein